MGWLNPKNPFAGDAPTAREISDRPTRASRRAQREAEDTRLIAFCQASTAHQKAITRYGRDSLEASRTRQAMNALNAGL
jgi:hypothetical protein